MANPTTNFGWVMPTSTDLVTDLPADFAVFGQAVDTSMADLKGGTTGQILSKATSADMDFTWVAANPGDITGVTAGTGISGGGTSGDVTVTNSMATAITTAGDLIKGTGSGTFDRLGIGSTGQVLTVAGGAPSWATATSGGMTSLASGSLSGTSTSISSIPSGYIHLFLILRNPTAATVGNSVKMRVNSTSSIYSNGFNLSSSSDTLNATTIDPILDTVYSTSAENAASIWFYDYLTTATSKLIFGQALNKNAASTWYYRQGLAIARTASAITSIQIEASSTLSGTYVLYGVK